MVYVNLSPKNEDWELKTNKDRTNWRTNEDCDFFNIYVYFSVDYEFYVVDDYGRMYENGSWDGLIAELINRHNNIHFLIKTKIENMLF